MDMGLADGKAAKRTLVNRALALSDHASHGHGGPQLVHWSVP
jgi:hypothetical protein